MFQKSSASIGGEWLALHRTGEFCAGTGSLRMADKYFRAALRVTDLLSITDPRAILTLDAIAALYETLGQYEEACSSVNRSLARKYKILGQFNELALNDLKKLVRLYSLRGMAEDAIRMERLCFRISENHSEFRNRITNTDQEVTCSALPTVPEAFIDVANVKASNSDNTVAEALEQLMHCGNSAEARAV
jgi:tetratricopeptide (TPR) repeat protein